MEEHVGDPDSTQTDGEAGEAAPSDYLESLRARFDELASRIEAATQESLERTQSLLTEPDATDQDADATPAAPTTSAADVDVLSTEDDAVNLEPQESATSDAALDAESEPVPQERRGSRFFAPPPMVESKPRPTEEAPAQPAVPEPDVPQVREGDSPTAEDTAADTSIAVDADLDAWDETAPPAEPARAPRSSPTPPATADRDLSDPQTLGAQLRSRIRPVADPHPRRKTMVRVLIVVVLVAIAAGAAWWWFQNDGDDAAPDEAPTEQTPPTTAASDAGALPTDNQPADTQAAATQALIDNGVTGVTVTIDEGTAVLTGSVDSEEAKATAAAVVASVPGVDTVDNRLVVEAPAPLDPAEIPAAAEQARDDTGFGHLGVTVIDGTATITGVMPLDDLAGGYFAYTAPLRDALLAINGIDAVRTRLQLSGEASTLSRDLDALFDATPIVFAAGSTALTPEDEVVLDQAAVIIADNPGLLVIVTGHPDPAGDAVANETLALERANAIVLYLAADGIPATRLIAASGPDTGVQVVFEVAP